MKRTYMVLPLAALIGLIALAACGGATAPTSAPAVQTVVVPQTVVVQPAQKTQVVYNSYESDPEPRKADAALVQMFMQENPDIQVTQSTVAHEDFKQAIRAYLTASTPPDVMTWFAGNRARFFIDKGVIMDISDVWKNEGWNDSYSKGFNALSSSNGKQYFVPTSYYWWAIYYNKKVMDKYSVKPPETWDDLIGACDTLNKNGITPIVIGTKAPWPAAGWFDYLDMRINGPQFHVDLTAGKVKYDDPRVKKVFDAWKQLLDHKCFIANPASYDWQEVVPNMVQGKAAMYLMGQFIMDSVPKENQADFDFVRFPVIDKSVPIGEDAPTDGFFAAANAPHPEAAKKFLAFMGGVEAQTYFAKTLNRLPTNSKVDISFFTPAVQKGIKLIQSADYVAQFYDRDTTPEMADLGMAQFIAFMAHPEQEDQILAELEKARARVFATPQQ